MESLAPQPHDGITENVLKPILPPELERVIFEMSIEDIVDHLPPTQCALNLQLTAKRVRSWIRPLFYRVFKGANSPAIFPDFEKHKDLKIEEIGPFIKYLLYDVYEFSQSRLLHTLRHCPNIEDLAIWCDTYQMSQLYPAISSFKHVKRLYAGLGGLTVEQVQEAPIFQNLTHLDLLGLPPNNLLQEFKNLTHFGTNTSTEEPDLADADAVQEHPSSQKVRTALDMVLTLPLLQVVKVYWSNPRANQGPVDFKDIRIVYLSGTLFQYTEAEWDWTMRANGKMDSWGFVSRIVYARKNNYMEYVPKRVYDPRFFSCEKELDDAGRIWWQSQSSMQ
ncbi:hypothetical protein CVT24_010842 [Panaeolus cyanescens]|uniref:F-box domain-containing protein n=1 Tax=Panaeolus cyanescens TaxID=181874 RepID=A0A409YYP5_9AGAR|nr:hypothetical protein CVT24_010842 [Panaeolus cyanescens]